MKENRKTDWCVRYDCYGQYNGQPIKWKCNYSFNPFTRVIRLDKVWQCSDKDEAHP